MGALEQDKYDYSVHTRLSKNTRLKIWKLFFLTSGRKLHASFSFALVFSFLGRLSTAQAALAGTPSSPDPLQGAPELGEEAATSSTAGAAAGEPAALCPWLLSQHQAGGIAASKRKSVRLPPPFTPVIKLWNRQWDIIAWDSLYVPKELFKEC